MNVDGEDVRREGIDWVGIAITLLWSVGTLVIYIQIRTAVALLIAGLLLIPALARSSRGIWRTIIIVAALITIGVWEYSRTSFQITLITTGFLVTATVISSLLFAWLKLDESRMPVRVTVLFGVVFATFGGYFFFSLSPLAYAGYALLAIAFLLVAMAAWLRAKNMGRSKTVAVIASLAYVLVVGALPIGAFWIL